MSDQDPFNQDPNRQKPWFGPKRFGFGYRPQTWQGVAVVVAVVLVAIIVSQLTGAHHSTKLFPGILIIAVVIGVRVLMFRQRRR